MRVIKTIFQTHYYSLEFVKSKTPIEYSQPSVYISIDFEYMNILILENTLYSLKRSSFQCISQKLKFFLKSHTPFRKEGGGLGLGFGMGLGLG